MKIKDQKEQQISLHQRSEKEIDAKYIKEEDGEKLCYITNFEFRDVSTNLFKSPESLTDEGVRLVLTGCLLTSEQAEIYYSSLLSNKKRIIQNDDGEDEMLPSSNYQVAITNLTQWVFDHGTEIHMKGVWVQTKKIWYKLIKPSEYFKLVYGPFERGSNIWLELRPVLLKWMKLFDKCSDERIASVLDMLSMELVMKTMGKKGYSENDIIENAEFIYDKVVQDLDVFSLEDDPEVNQVLRTKFVQELFKKSKSSAEKLDLDEEYPVARPAPKSKKPKAKKEISYSSPEEKYYQVEIDDTLSESSTSSEEEYKFKEENFSDEDEYQSLEEEDEEYIDEDKKTDNNKRKIPLKIEKAKRRKNKPERDPNLKPTNKRAEVHVTTFTLPPGVPTAEELLSQEFTPRLFTKLITKYEPGVIPTLCFECKDNRINCLKQRPMCSKCLEKGKNCTYPKYLRLAPCIPCSLIRGKVCNRRKPCCNHCKEGACYYFTEDTYTLIAEMKKKAVEELYAKYDALEKSKENQISTSLSPISEDEEETVPDSQLVEDEENKQKALKLKKEIEKWKRIAQEEEEHNSKILKQLGDIVSNFK